MLRARALSYQSLSLPITKDSQYLKFSPSTIPDTYIPEDKKIAELFFTLNLLDSLSWTCKSGKMKEKHAQALLIFVEIKQLSTVLNSANFLQIKSTRVQLQGFFYPRNFLLLFPWIVTVIAELLPIFLLRVLLQDFNLVFNQYQDSLWYGTDKHWLKTCNKKLFLHYRKSSRKYSVAGS